MSLFQFGFTVKETVNSKNSAAHSQPANAGACAFSPEQEATNLGSEEYNEVIYEMFHGFMKCFMAYLNTMKLYCWWETL